MPKPIVLIKVNTESLGGKSTKQSLFDIQSALDDRLNDYHVLVVHSRDEKDTLKMEVFYEKDFTEIEYSELKQIVIDSLKQNKNANNKIH